jgi:hypothetical protein
MAIKEVTMYTCVCDYCGKSADEGTDWSCWNDKNVADEVARNAGWIRSYDYGDITHYCTDCFEIKDDDTIVLKPKKISDGC